VLVEDEIGSIHISDDLEFTIPIGGIYILDPSGIPLFARYYQGEIDKMDSTLLGGFFSAIEIFVKTSLDGLLSDIGMTNSRFFFDRSNSGYIVVIIVFTSSDTLVDEHTLEIVRSLQSTINIGFDILSKTAETNLMSVEVLIENLGTTIDSFLLETLFEHISPDQFDQSLYENLQSEQLSDDQLDLIIETIESNR